MLIKAERYHAWREVREASSSQSRGSFGNPCSVQWWRSLFMGWTVCLSSFPLSLWAFWQSNLRMWARQPHPWRYCWPSMPASDGWLHCDLCLMVSGHDLSQKLQRVARMGSIWSSPGSASFAVAQCWLSGTQIFLDNHKLIYLWTHKIYLYDFFFLFLSFFPLLVCQSHILVDCPSLQGSGLCIQARCPGPKHQPQLLDLRCFPLSLLGTWFLLGQCVMPAYMSTRLRGLL